MPADRSKRPVPAVMDVGTIQRKFRADEACWEHLRSTRWGANLERFTCRNCGHAKCWWLANRRLVECCERRRQTIQRRRPLGRTVLRPAAPLRSQRISTAHASGRGHRGLNRRGRSTLFRPRSPRDSARLADRPATS